MIPTELPAWKTLATLATQQREQPLGELLQDPTRTEDYVHEVAGCLFDFSKQWVSDTVLEQLVALAAACSIAQRRTDMYAGKIINTSEQRAVLHTALRGGSATAPADVQSDVQETLTRLVTCAERIRCGAWRGYSGKSITDVVHIGIGGSHLGPELVVNALSEFHTTPLRLHFVANIDAHDLHAALKGLNPETTLFVIVSKSFGTLETRVNALSARSWFLERTGQLDGIGQHFIGVTSNIDAAQEFGLREENLFPIWDWVGGRFSLWSAVGMPILLSIGAEHFFAFLAGARAVDEHFENAEPRANIPLLSALFATWNYNFLGAGSLAVLPYDERLSLLPDYLQQLEMESNGKSIDRDGQAVATHSMPILWGGTGTRGQHAYHQLLHQGTRGYAADFILVRTDALQRKEHHDWLIANALAQSQAMAVGHPNVDEPHRAVPGNHPTTTIVLDQLGPQQLGALLAVYEHKVFCQGVIWNINSFDQWGVELGKQLAEPIYAALAKSDTEDQGNVLDPVARNLIRHIRHTAR